MTPEEIAAPLRAYVRDARRPPSPGATRSGGARGRGAG
jgi:hypothetical protein